MLLEWRKFLAGLSHNRPLTDQEMHYWFPPGRSVVLGGLDVVPAFADREVEGFVSHCTPVRFAYGKPTLYLHLRDKLPPPFPDLIGPLGVDTFDRITEISETVYTLTLEDGLVIDFRPKSNPSCSTQPTSSSLQPEPPIVIKHENSLQVKRRKI